MQTMTPPVTPATLAFAEGLFTKRVVTLDCLGPNEIKQVFGIDLNPELVPPIPFSEEELTHGRELGQMLTLYVDKMQDGKPLTMCALRNQFGNELGDGGLLDNTDWYERESREAFFLTETPTLRWKLTSREVIPDSTSVDYVGQTVAIAEYLRNQVYVWMEMPALYQEALDEFESRKEEFERLVDKDWKKATEQLADLKLNQLFRETPVEVLYRLILYFKVNKTRLLESTYTYTKVRSSRGYPVYLGRCASGGVRVVGDYPWHSGSGLGVCFSRSGLPSET